MNKAELIAKIAEDAGITKTQANTTLDSFVDAVTKTLLPAIQNAQLKDLVTKIAPAFVAHRDRAQMLLDHLK